MDTWQEQWEEGCPGGLNTTPHLSLEVRAFRHFFSRLRRDPPPKPSAEEGIKMFLLLFNCTERKDWTKYKKLRF